MLPAAGEHCCQRSNGRWFSGIEEAKQFLLVVLAELCSHAHVPNHGS
jgi:hypothetical protein